MKVFIRNGCYGLVPGTTVALEEPIALHLIRHGFADQVEEEIIDEIQDGVYLDNEDL